jgi:cation diffusion facilitator CzcD-associated flavoprotein CzcO
MEAAMTRNESLKFESTSELTEVDVAIIGAGFAGLGMGIRLKMEGKGSFVIFERADELGGTWRDNVYPGCACDVPSLVYSFSFDQNPNWSRKYPTQPEIWAYLKKSALRFDIRANIRFNQDVTRLQFYEVQGYWLLQTRQGERVKARVVVAGIGPLNRPMIPELAGLESFAGVAFHSSAWDTAFEIKDKRLAIVGTGASAIQIVPQVSKVAQHVSIFQRTPPWIVPRDDRAITKRRQSLFRKVPFFQNMVRIWQYWQLEIQVLAFLGNNVMQEQGQKIARQHIERSIADPDLRQAVTPNYAFGCKRVLLSDDYYPALQRPNVELITAGISEVKAHSIVDQAGIERSIDAIIFCTGFVASEMPLDMKIYGRNNRELLAEWKKTGPEAYYGLSVAGYPNLFFLLGPNTGLGHNSVLQMIESQHNYIMDYLRLLDKEGVPYLDIKPDIYAQHNAEIQQKLQKTVWQAGGCISWYQNQSGKNTTLWPGWTAGYRLKTYKAHRAAYER